MLSVSSNGSLGLKLKGEFSEDAPCHTLSVSSNGSLGLKPPVATARYVIEHKLSVSSNGSLGLKLQKVVGDLAQVVPFSILERIVGVETPGDHAAAEQGPAFQYPRTDRWG